MKKEPQDSASVTEELSTASAIWAQMKLRTEDPVRYDMPLNEIKALDADFEALTISFSVNRFVTKF
jgi:hypothetical protein